VVFTIVPCTEADDVKRGVSVNDVEERRRSFVVELGGVDWQRRKRGGGDESCRVLVDVFDESRMPDYTSPPCGGEEDEIRRGLLIVANVDTLN